MMLRKVAMAAAAMLAVSPQAQAKDVVIHAAG
jgi:hypothetical protein